MVPAAVAVVSIVAAVAVLVAWKPWVNTFKIRLAFPSVAPVAPTLTEQLVFDIPPAELSAASLGTGEDELETFADFDGYFFAAPNAEFKLGQGSTGRWAAFFATPYDELADPDIGQGAVDVIVQGAPGELTPALDDQSLQLAFGPLDGQIYHDIGSVVAWVEGGRVVMVTGQVPIAELLELAESVRPATDTEWAEVSDAGFD